MYIGHIISNLKVDETLKTPCFISVHCGDDLTSDSDCVVQLWKVLEGFNMEDRSRFLRFVSGRKRLPASITLSHMCGEKDTLPSASTCASTLMLPSYSSVHVAEKKLRLIF